ncbi:MAG: hypothetical protein ACQGVK_10850 [Myxococcota bacterium]
MSRLAATLGLDARLQARNRVYWIVTGVAVALALALRALFTPDQLRFFMPVLALSGVSITAFFLVGVLLMLERGEGTLDVVLVSPLRPAEYLASKLFSVTSLALGEALIVTGVGYGAGFQVSWLVLGVLLRAGLTAAVGVALAVRYRGLTDFLLPAIAFSMAFDLPLLWYLEVWPAAGLALWPTWPSLLLAKAAFTPVDTLHLAYACGYGALALGAAVFWALRAIDRYVVRGGQRP